ncbi:MrfE family protein [Buttiauxella brennerae ATCC 51605]|uniref:MrfE family protein n=1 Tax=Buttiauxella brennerae ATCC 51605 TaxID=1354251 RepID=A0A1B7INM2_9ENTR|nr:fimbrial protein [Buttiauxella brennerae]OAT31259.1 MrfE family protein [Buttiauxella brennerae ATCC 51605]
MRAGMFLMVMMLSSPVLRAQTVDTGEVDGQHGQINVDGIMTESPCMLDMVSDFQEIELGVINNAQLRKPGDQGPRVEFDLTLRHCLSSDSRLTNQSNGTVSGASDQPVMYMEFVSANDGTNPDLIQVKGIHGVGLRLKDDRYHVVHLGEFTAPLFLNSGQNMLKYNIAIERTSEKLVLGPFHAMVDFKIHYY